MPARMLKTKWYGGVGVGLGHLGDVGPSGARVEEARPVEAHGHEHHPDEPEATPPPVRSRLWASEMGFPVRLGMSHHREPMAVRVTRLATWRWKWPAIQAVLWTT